MDRCEQEQLAAFAAAAQAAQADMPPLLHNRNLLRQTFDKCWKSETTLVWTVLKLLLRIEFGSMLVSTSPYAALASNYLGQLADALHKTCTTSARLEVAAIKRVQAEAGPVPSLQASTFFGTSGMASSPTLCGAVLYLMCGIVGLQGEVLGVPLPRIASLDALVDKRRPSVTDMPLDDLALCVCGVFWPSGCVEILTDLVTEVKNRSLFPVIVQACANAMVAAAVDLVYQLPACLASTPATNPLPLSWVRHRGLQQLLFLTDARGFSSSWRQPHVPASSPADCFDWLTHTGLDWDGLLGLADQLQDLLAVQTTADQELECAAALSAAWTFLPDVSKTRCVVLNMYHIHAGAGAELYKLCDLAGMLRGPRLGRLGSDIRHELLLPKSHANGFVHDALHNVLVQSSLARPWGQVPGHGYRAEGTLRLACLRACAGAFRGRQEAKEPVACRARHDAEDGDGDDDALAVVRRLFALPADTMATLVTAPDFGTAALVPTEALEKLLAFL